jgi:hypothetical protein
MASVKTRIGNVEVISFNAHRSTFKNVAVPRLPDAIFCLVNFSTGSRTRGYSPFGLPVFQTE